MRRALGPAGTALLVRASVSLRSSCSVVGARQVPCGRAGYRSAPCADSWLLAVAARSRAAAGTATAGAPARRHARRSTSRPTRPTPASTPPSRDRRRRRQRRPDPDPRRPPRGSPDSLKLLATRRADIAVLDIHDLGLARERGADVVGVGRPRAAAAGRGDRARDAASGGRGIWRAGAWASRGCPPTTRCCAPWSRTTAVTSSGATA